MDFAKHSECISKKDFHDVQEKVKRYPDYLVYQNKQNREVYQSEHVLGKMFRHVQIKEFYEQCTRTEYIQSIKYNYKVRPLLLSYFKDATQFGQPEDLGIGLGDHLEHLLFAYQRIVAPMTRQIKEIMRTNNLINEAEMFCTDLEFRTDDQGQVTNFIGDVSKKQDDVVRNIQVCLNDVILLFKNRFKEMVKKDRTVQTKEQESMRMRSLALCIYFATYCRLDHN